MRKSLLVTAATLFVIGQAFAQGQSQQPPGQNNQSNATTQNQKVAPTGTRKDTNAQGTQGDTTKSAVRTSKSGSHRTSSKHASHRMARHSRYHSRMAHAGMPQGQPRQQAFGFGQQQRPQKMGPCKKGQLPDGVHCM